MKCQICGKEYKSLGTHLIRTHKIKLKDYYDEYLRFGSDGVCLVCGGDTVFGGLGGYAVYCSHKCSSNSQSVKDKRSSTNIMRYGESHHLKNKIIMAKQIKTMNERYGVDRPYQNDEIRHKGHTTCIDKFGCISPLGNKVIQIKIRDCVFDRYGVDNVSKADHVKQKIKHSLATIDKVEIHQRRVITCNDKYDVDNVSQNQYVKGTKKETSIKRYGVDHWSKTDDGRSICRDNAISFVENQKLNGEPLMPRIGSMERPCLNELQIFTDYIISRNPRVIGYFPDGYIKELNIVIEFDERHHFIDNYQTYCNRDLKKNKDYHRAGLLCFRIKKIEWEQNKRNVIKRFKELINEN